MKTEIAVFGGGCFWCTEAVFRSLPGVKEVEPGYAGGTRDNPTYEKVCSGVTGHAEVVKVTFDPVIVPYQRLLDAFFTVHDPTTQNRQGNDVGSQYRSIILYATEKQAAEAREYVKLLEKAACFEAPIVTEIRPLDKFWPSEDYHRDYYTKNASAPYCRAVIRPKLAKIKH